MKVEFARPDVSQLSLHVFERTVHPELFDVYAETHIAGQGFEAVLRICVAGHVVEFRHGERRVTEVIGSLDQILPQRGRSLVQKLRGGRDLDVEADGVAYCCSAHVEQLEPEVFDEVQGELQADAGKALLAYQFPTRHRLDSGALSVMQAEAAGSSLIIHAFHTFPESRSVLRTQSLFDF
jgi:hypothetical protein